MSEAESAVPGESVFVKMKESDEAMVHRLRRWEEGETIWGYDVVSESGSSGKTFKRGDSGLIDEDESMVPIIENRMEEMVEAASSPVVGFVWCATIDSVRSEGGTMDDPEPPLKYAQLSDVVVKSMSKRE